MEEEGLTAAAAAAAVLRDNLFGLEVDPRCTQLGAFALALDAWKAGGHQHLPVPNIACSGIAVKGQLDDWRRLAGDDENMAAALERLYTRFQDAPELGSLIDPTAAAGDGFWRVDPAELQAKLETALAKERNDPAAAVFGAAAEGTAKAARLLAGRYWLVATNPPFLSLKKAGGPLKDFMAATYSEAKLDLATVFFDASLRRSPDGGSVAFVLPLHWLNLVSYRDLRRLLLRRDRLDLIVLLGQGAFEAISGGVVNVCLTQATAGQADGHLVGFLDVTTSVDRDEAIRSGRITQIDQGVARNSADARLLEPGIVKTTLGDYCEAPRGIVAGDRERFVRVFWEGGREGDWRYLQSTVPEVTPFGGRQHVIDWRQRHLMLRPGMGNTSYGRAGVSVTQVDKLSATLYAGDLYDNNCVAIVPTDPAIRPALWAFVSSPELHPAVRRLDKKLNVTNATFLQVPFDLEHWTKVAAEQYPNGLPEPHSDDPAQWLFKGTIIASTAPLQVAVARLLGYRWPDEDHDDLDELSDVDGIVPLPPVRAEAPAAERLRALLARAYGPAWSPALLDALLRDAGSAGATLESWLRDGFFSQHARLFDNRPFIWQVWDGRKDGFSVLLNYHRLDGPMLQKLTYTYLNDWIERQRARREEPAAEARLVAALALQAKLRQILEGEPPFDIFVRWKSLAEQPIGWEPDLDDGVRLNIRPFVLAGVLRAKFNIHWKKDRGRNPDGSERLNDLHYSRAEKLAARERIS
jgi:hypothetical protein